jgi:hypothetical protein
VLADIFRTVNAIYTAVVVVRSTCSNRPNCEIRVLLRRFAATEWKRAKTSPEIWREQTWLLHHNNATSHTSVPTQQFLAKPKMTVIPHPSYYTYLAVCDLFLSPKKKIEAERMPVWYHWEDPGRIAQREKDFQKSFQKWKIRWDQRLHAGGHYFKNNGSR